jgi:hypothetical protein
MILTFLTLYVYNVHVYRQMNHEDGAYNLIILQDCSSCPCGYVTDICELHYYYYNNIHHKNCCHLTLLP